MEQSRVAETMPVQIRLITTARSIVKSYQATILPLQTPSTALFARLVISVQLAPKSRLLAPQEPTPIPELVNALRVGRDSTVAILQSQTSNDAPSDSISLIPARTPVSRALVVSIAALLRLRPVPMACIPSKERASVGLSLLGST